MKRILILGAGRSSSSLIQYLLQNSRKFSWEVSVGDADENLAREKINGYESATAIKFDIKDKDLTNEEIKNSDLVISMLPASLHVEVLKCCLHFKKNMITASYISEEIKKLKKEIDAAGILVLKECGLDPGLDHMSAMEVIDEIKERGGEIISFKSYTGGLIAPDSDDNPWGYKFTWNPRNVILAGQGTARFISNGLIKYIPYHRLFERFDTINIEGKGEFEGYANRDSLSYREIYNLKDIPTLVRGTLRKSGFCAAWNAFVQLGLTDDSYTLEDSGTLTYKSFINSFLPFSSSKSVEENFSSYTMLKPNSEEFQKIKWLGLFEDRPIPLSRASPAQVLQYILEEKWQLRVHDKDMIVMQHRFDYKQGAQSKTDISELVVLGDDNTNTAMAKTVGIPLGIIAKLVLNGEITLKGLHIPVVKEIYKPVLRELEGLGVRFYHRNT